jgi:ATP:cob(I)alamin adenosyltransferase
MANLYTKTGDKGQTSLVGGSRVSKSDLQVECYGTIDEANSMLGLAYSNTCQEYIRTTIHTIQGRLFSLGAELASDREGASKLKNLISEEDVAFLENVVDTCTETTGKMTHFVIPGVDSASSALHVARTIVRRAERRMVELAGSSSVREVVMRYVNRLSDAIYAMARLQEETVAQAQMREKVTEMVKNVLAGYADGLPPISLEILERMAERAKEKSRELGVPVVFSAVDGGGNLLLLERMEGALPGSVEVSAGKAYTANAFHMPTHELGQAARQDGPLYGIENAAPGKIILFGGGFPYVSGGQIVGGIGVSGGTVEQDIEIARYAMSI